MVFGESRPRQLSMGHATKRGIVNRPEKARVDHPETSRQRRASGRGLVEGKGRGGADHEVGDWRRLDDHNRRLDNFSGLRGVGSLSLCISRSILLRAGIGADGT